MDRLFSILRQLKQRVTGRQPDRPHLMKVPLIHLCQADGNSVVQTHSFAEHEIA